MRNNSNGRPKSAADAQNLEGEFRITRTNYVDPDSALQRFAERVATASTPWWKRALRKERFVTQQRFNMCTVSTVRISVATGRPMEDAATEIWRHYDSKYSDRGLVDEIVEAALLVEKFMSSVLPTSTLKGSLGQIQFCIANLKPDGTKRRRRLLEGTRDSWEPIPVSGKAKRCLAQIATFHHLALIGAIPMGHLR